mmetsp:Transcript_12860/g.39687  ORF Transcript_12860/g.39687 Transcript_12860/m.39687 type:complete len:152 (+) Transcript_12860:113-568(+)
MSSLFLDFPCSVSGKTKVIAATWCAVEPICAFLTNGNFISFFLEEGVSLEECKISRKTNATAVAWHPKVKSIACGWQDGHVSVWGLASNGAGGDGVGVLTSTCIFAKDSKHDRTPVCITVWNPSATRLVTADVSGLILIWKVCVNDQCRSL